MMKNQARIGSLLFFCFLIALMPAFSFAGSRAQLQVEVESPQVEEGENVAVDFIVTAPSMLTSVGTPRYSAPDFDEVNVFQRGRNIQSSYVNGAFSTETSIRITAVLNPKKKGQLKIRNISLEVDGETLKAPDLTIEVGDSGSLSKNRLGVTNPQSQYGYNQSQRSVPLPRAGANPQQGAMSLFLRTEPDKSQAFKGEQIILNYVLYTRVQIAGIQVERFPTASGFLKEDLEIPVLQGPGGLQWTRSVIGGVEYRRAVVASYALFPVKEGSLPLDLFSARITFRGGSQFRGLMNDEDDVFGLNQFFQAFSVVTEARQSDRRTIEVLPLPGGGQPPGFSGLVGDFDISANADKTVAKAGEAINVKVTIEGKGHAGGMETLRIDWPADFEQYEDKSATIYNRNGTSQRVFDYLIIPKAKGQYQIPPIEVSMFNPETKSYQTKKTNPLSIEVLEGVTGQTSSLGSARSSVPQNAAPEEIQQQEIRYLLSSNDVSQGGISNFLLKISQFLAGLSFLALISSVGLWWRSAQPKAKVRAQAARRLLDQKVRALESKVPTDPLSALTGVDNVLTEYLQLECGLSRGSLRRDELVAALIEKGVDPQTAKAIEELSTLCENQRFLPAELAKNSALAQKALDALKSIISTLG